MHKRLKELRKKLGLRQREIAARLGFTTSSWGNFESGRAKLPRARLYQLCKEFNVNEDWLVNGRGDMFAPPPPPVNEREAQRLFVLNCFRSLPPESRAAILDALREYVGGQSSGTASSVIVGDNNGTVNQTITIKEREIE